MLLWGLQVGLGAWLADSFIERVLALVLLVAAGLAIYGALSFALGAVSRRELLAALRRRPAGEPRPEGP